MEVTTSNAPASRPDDLLTTREAAELLGITPGALRNARWLGSGPPFVHVRREGHRVWYRRGDLDRYMYGTTPSLGGRR